MISSTDMRSGQDLNEKNYPDFECVTNSFTHVPFSSYSLPTVQADTLVLAARWEVFRQPRDLCAASKLEH